MHDGDVHRSGGLENIVGIDVRPADTALYALGSTGRLYTADAATGALTLKSTLAAALGDGSAPYAGLVGTEFGIDFNPGNDGLRVVSDTGQNLRVTVDNGNTITDVDGESGGPDDWAPPPTATASWVQAPRSTTPSIRPATACRCSAARRAAPSTATCRP